MGLKQNLQEFFQFGEVKDTIMSLIEAKFQLKKIEIQEKVEYGVIELIYVLIQAFAGLLALTFLLLIGAYFLNIWLGAPWGYVVVFSLCLALFLGVLFAKGTIKEKIKERVVKEVDAIDD